MARSSAARAKTENKGRPVKIYELAKPISGIMDSIEEVMKEEATNKLALIQELWDYRHYSHPKRFVFVIWFS